MKKGNYRMLVRNIRKEEENKRSEQLHHKAKALTKEEVEANRSNAYKYLDL